MNRNNKTSSITEAAMIAGILVIIAFLSSFISMATLFYPTPAIILAKRRGIYRTFTISSRYYNFNSFGSYHGFYVLHTVYTFFFGIGIWGI